jgi:hypothetical protein
MNRKIDSKLLLSFPKSKLNIPDDSQPKKIVAKKISTPNSLQNRSRL